MATTTRRAAVATALKVCLQGLAYSGGRSAAACRQNSTQAVGGRRRTEGPSRAGSTWTRPTSTALLAASASLATTGLDSAPYLKSGPPARDTSAHQTGATARRGD